MSRCNIWYGKNNKKESKGKPNKMRGCKVKELKKQLKFARQVVAGISNEFYGRKIKRKATKKREEKRSRRNFRAF